MWVIGLSEMQDIAPPLNGNLSPREKLCLKDALHKKDDRMSPRSDASSHSSVSSLKAKMEVGLPPHVDR